MTPDSRARQASVQQLMHSCLQMSWGWRRRIPRACQPSKTSTSRRRGGGELHSTSDAENRQVEGTVPQRLKAREKGAEERDRRRERRTDEKTTHTQRSRVSKPGPMSSQTRSKRKTVVGVRVNISNHVHTNINTSVQSRSKGYCACRGAIMCKQKATHEAKYQ